MSNLSLSAIYRYPVKSARGHALQEARTDAFGIAGDRRWMLVDERGVFVSQRTMAAMALLEVSPAPDGLLLTYRGAQLAVATPAPGAARESVRVWSDQLEGLSADDAANHWLSQRFGVPLRLVYCPDDARRAVDPHYCANGARVAFPDGFPLLVLTQASLDDLNRRLPAPVPMDRFRPNLVISGAEAFDEDRWSRLRIGGVQIDLVKPCSRCAVPSIDQATGERDSSINRVLADFRRRDGQIYFGMNALVPAGARLAVGDAVAVLH